VRADAGDAAPEAVHVAGCAEARDAVAHLRPVAPRVRPAPGRQSRRPRPAAQPAAALSGVPGTWSAERRPPHRGRSPGRRASACHHRGARAARGPRGARHR